MNTNLKLITGIHPKKPMKIVTGIGYLMGEGEIKELETICNFPLPSNFIEADTQFEYAKKFVSAQKMYEVCEMVLSWWDKHEYDFVTSDGEEFNVFGDIPDFVFEARQAIKKQPNETSPRT